MKVALNAGKYLSLILWLVAIHSIVVGLSLILIPASMMPSFGFQSYTEKFFPVQGGVFHLVMAVVYALAAIDTKRFAGLITLAIVAKFMATVFLLIYYFLVDKIWTVLFSAIGDCLMGTAILIAFLSFTKNKEHL